MIRKDDEYVWIVSSAGDDWPICYCETEQEAAMICAEYNDLYNDEDSIDIYYLVYRKLRHGFADDSSRNRKLYRIIIAYAEYDAPGVYDITCKDLRRGLSSQRWTFNYEPPEVWVNGFDDGELDNNYCIRVYAEATETDDEVYQKMADALRDFLKERGVPLADG